jgi:hypothetical protein
LETLHFLWNGKFKTNQWVLQKKNKKPPLGRKDFILRMVTERLEPTAALLMKAKIMTLAGKCDQILCQYFVSSSRFNNFILPQGHNSRPPGALLLLQECSSRLLRVHPKLRHYEA